MKKENKSEAAKLRQNEEGILGNSAGEPLISYRYVRSLIEATIDPLVAINVEGKIADVNLATENYGYLSKYDWFSIIHDLIETWYEEKEGFG